MKRQQYITAVNADGTTSAAGIIHEWHDEDHLTAEWLPFSDVRYLLGAGMEPDPDSPVTPEMCENIDL